MELRVRDVARLLNVPEETVYRWVRDESLPAHRFGPQLRFNRVELQEWATLHRLLVPPESFAAPGHQEGPSLRAALARGGIARELRGETREQVLCEVCALPGVPAGVDRSLLAQLLISREALVSTAIGDGIAIPHPRDPLVVRVDAPYALLGFLAHPVDFGAMDGQPVRLLFTLLSPSVRQHLQLLATLSFALHDPALRRLLDAAAPDAAILERIEEIEAAPRKTPPDLGSGPRRGAR